MVRARNYMYEDDYWSGFILVHGYSLVKVQFQVSDSSIQHSAFGILSGDNHGPT